MQLDTGALLESLHAGIFEQPLWSTFLDRLRARAGARYVTLIFRPLDGSGLIELASGDPLSPDLRNLLGARFAHDLSPYRTMREGRIYSLEELLDMGDPVPETLRKSIMAGDMEQGRIVRVAEPGGVDAWLSVSGRRHAGSAIGALLAAIVPHLRIALRAFVALERERFRSEVATEAFRRLNFDWLSLDARCRIVHMTPHMEQFFQRSTVLRRGRYDRLTPASPAVDRQLTALVKQFATDADARPKAINLSRDPLIDMLVSPVPGREPSPRTQPVAIVYVSGDRLSQADRCDQLVDLFGLLPSEARLAWAIAQGMTIAEAADNLGLTLETARNYSKKIYAKTGARGQAELVRNILTSVLALA